MIATGLPAEIILPYPHAGQRIVRRTASRHNWLFAGRRWRKTTLAMAVVVEAALSGQQVIWGAPTYDQVRVCWDETRHACGNIGQFSESRMEVGIGKGRIIYRSLDDPDNARGHTADGLVIDEGGYVSEAAWYEVLRPMLMDTGGWSWVIGTPHGRTWFWREWIAAADRSDSMAWQAPTLGVEITAAGLVRKPHPLENPHVSFAEIQRMYETLPEHTFRQEILAEAIEETGGVFRRVVEAATAIPQERSIYEHQYVIGVDWGRSVDFTVFSVADLTTREIVYIDRSNQVEYAMQRGRLGALYERFHPITIIPESNSIGEPIIEQLRRDGLPVQPFTTTNASKAAIIDGLALAFERGDIRIIPDPTLVSELQAYEAERLPSGLTRYSAPEGMHDDTVMATALAWYGATEAAGAGHRSRSRA